MANNNNNKNNANNFALYKYISLFHILPFIFFFLVDVFYLFISWTLIGHRLRFNHLKKKRKERKKFANPRQKFHNWIFEWPWVVASPVKTTREIHSSVAIIKGKMQRAANIKLIVTLSRFWGRELPTNCNNLIVTRHN